MLLSPNTTGTRKNCLFTTTQGTGFVNENILLCLIISHNKGFCFIVVCFVSFVSNPTLRNIIIMVLEDY